MSNSPTDKFVVVVPAHNAGETLGACIEGLFCAGITAGDIVVVDDGSSDETGAIALAAGVHLMTNAVSKGAAASRNAGAAEATARTILFVDADVVICPDVPARIMTHIDGSDASAVFGSYDDTPPETSVLSRYRNLLHHHVHQSAPRDAITFWTGLGAVQRSEFQAIGGFDETFSFLEDVDFGLRLKQIGATILLDPDIQGKHLKNWTLRSMFMTDLFGRAIPWTRLLKAGRIPSVALQSESKHKVSAVSLVVFLASIIAGVVWPTLFVLALLAMLAFVLANLDFLRFLNRTAGVGFAIRALPYHAVHYTAAITGYVFATVFKPKA